MHPSTASSSYSIKNVNGKFEKVNMGKIKAIANHFNIQAANPVHIMTQESTKDFLNAKSKKHKYNLFMQGTTLTQTKVYIFKISRKLIFIRKTMIVLAMKSTR